ncbi:MAG: xanthine dehydrogenase family protein molybdopterin-binding subunit, partial [Gammaproteobacteria bacterium]|nr:xanthine dehydrogenase family protein molybdopterin-binding subunit [Gammaproteobacteria bacterium]
AGAAVDLHVPRIFAAVDCGLVVSPVNAEAQIQGGIVFGLSAALGEAITLKDGIVEQTNFDRYQLLRMPQAPEVKVEFIDVDAPPGGLGEPGVPPVAPAVANAWFAATGQRLRRLPLRAALRQAAG